MSRSDRFDCLYFGLFVFCLRELWRAFVLLWRALLDRAERSLHLDVLLASSLVVDLSVALFTNVLFAVFAKQRSRSCFAFVANQDLAVRIVRRLRIGAIASLA